MMRAGAGCGSSPPVHTFGLTCRDTRRTTSSSGSPRRHQTRRPENDSVLQPRPRRDVVPTRWPACNASEIPRDSARTRRYPVSNITPCLWFDGNAEEAAQFYTSILPDSRIDQVLNARGRHAERPEGRRPDGRVHARRQSVHRPQRRPGLQIQRVDLLRDRLQGPGRGRPLLGRAGRGRRRAQRLRLAEGPLRRLVAGHPAAAQRADGERPDRAAAERATQAMLQMTKIDVAKLEEAFKGEPALAR